MEPMGKKRQFCSVGCKRKQHCVAYRGNSVVYFLVINGQIYNVGSICGSNANKKYNEYLLQKNLK
jgi:hypothetical protein